MNASFPSHERRLLLAAPGIGATVVGRLEAAGFASLQALRDVGAAKATEAVLLQLGQVAWKNRRRAIARAIEQVAAHDGAY